MIYLIKNNNIVFDDLTKAMNHVLNILINNLNLFNFEKLDKLNKLYEIYEMDINSDIIYKVYNFSFKLFKFYFNKNIIDKYNINIKNKINEVKEMYFKKIKLIDSESINSINYNSDIDDSNINSCNKKNNSNSELNFNNNYNIEHDNNDSDIYLSDESNKEDHDELKNKIKHLIDKKKMLENNLKEKNDEIERKFKIDYNLFLKLKDEIKDDIPIIFKYKYEFFKNIDINDYDNCKIKYFENYDIINKDIGSDMFKNIF